MMRGEEEGVDEVVVEIGREGEDVEGVGDEDSRRHIEDVRCGWDVWCDVVWGMILKRRERCAFFSPLFTLNVFLCPFTSFLLLSNDRRLFCTLITTPQTLPKITDTYPMCLS